MNKNYKFYFIVSFLGLLISILTFFPGWMSPDSINQYLDSKKNIYSDWHPILMAIWWRQLNFIYEGPGLFLIQNLLLYWTSLLLLTLAFDKIFGFRAILFLLVGFWPGLLFPLGMIWKDIVFAVSVIFVWAIFWKNYTYKDSFNNFQRVIIVVLLLFAYGVKINGLVLIPIMFYVWFTLEQLFINKWIKKSFVAIVATSLIVIINMFITYSNNVVKTHPFQYVQTYDLLAISVATNKNLLPNYINEKISNINYKLKELYFVGGNNVLFYNTVGNLKTLEKSDLNELNHRWFSSILKYPKEYFIHRYNNFISMIRIGENTSTYVAAAGIDNNSFGFDFSKNTFSNLLSSTVDKYKYVYFPWVYMIVLIVSIVSLNILRKDKFMINMFGLSAFVFIVPHFFILPAYDYRYLYYSYFVAIIVGVLFLLHLFDKIFRIVNEKR